MGDQPDALDNVMNADGRGDASAPWEEPVPLEGTADLPAFPTNVLPGWLRAWVDAESLALQVPEDLPAMLALAVVATGVAGKVTLLVREGWTEPLAIWTATAMPPAERKSAAFEDATTPISTWEAEQGQRLAPQIAEEASRYRMAEAERDKAEAKAAAAPNAEERAKRTAEAVDLAKSLADMKVSALPKIVADDCTPESLATLLAIHDGRMAVLSPEGDVFDILAGRYSSGVPNLGVFLKGHAGDALRVNRRGRAEYVPHPALTLGLAVQPDVLRGLQSKPGFRGRGLLGRFLFALPVSKVGRREATPPAMPTPVRSAYHRNIRTLLDLSMSTDSDGQPAPHVLRMTVAAQDGIAGFCR